jgi:ribonuclease III
MMLKTHKLLLFKDEKLLDRALTHSSYANENPGDTGDNERLEFLGDAILTFLCAEYLYQRYGDMKEDEMTRRRAALVDEKRLAQFAIEVGLDVKMRLGKGLIKNGGDRNPNILSSAFEAAIAAYYLDNNRDIEIVRVLVNQLFDSVPQSSNIIRSNVDFKTQFQEWVQKKGIVIPPKYITEKIGGTDSIPEFLARVYVEDRFCGEGRGRSKKEAEKQAAENASIELKIIDS